MPITIHGRGPHGSMPHAAVDPVVLAASIVVRLQTIVSREVAPGEPAGLTVGSIQAGTKSNVIPDTAQLLLNVRTYSDAVRRAALDGIERIVTGECQAAAAPRQAGLRTIRALPTHRQRRRPDRDRERRVRGAVR